MPDDPNNRQTRRQDVVNGILMVIGGSALALMSAVVGYLLVEDRTRSAEFQKEIISQISSLEDKVTRLEVKSSICECTINQK